MNDRESEKQTKTAGTVSSDTRTAATKLQPASPRRARAEGTSEETETQLELCVLRMDSYILIMARKAVYFEENFPKVWFRGILLLAINQTKVWQTKTFGAYAKKDAMKVLFK